MSLSPKPLNPRSVDTTLFRQPLKTSSTTHSGRGLAQPAAEPWGRLLFPALPQWQLDSRTHSDPEESTWQGSSLYECWLEVQKHGFSLFLTWSTWAVQETPDQPPIRPRTCHRLPGLGEAHVVACQEHGLWGQQSSKTFALCAR